MVYTLRFFSLKNEVCFIILTYLVPVLFTFYIQGVLKFKKNLGAKRLIRISRSYAAGYRNFYCTVLCSREILIAFAHGAAR